MKIERRKKLQEEYLRKVYYSHINFLNAKDISDEMEAEHEYKKHLQKERDIDQMQNFIIISFGQKYFYNFFKSKEDKERSKALNDYIRFKNKLKINNALRK